VKSEMRIKVLYLPPPSVELRQVLPLIFPHLPSFETFIVEVGDAFGEEDTRLQDSFVEEEALGVFGSLVPRDPVTVPRSGLNNHQYHSRHLY
jgi:hypothetical protein